MINLDFDEQGRRIGIEVLAAGSTLREYRLKSLDRLDRDGSGTVEHRPADYRVQLVASLL
ncbi:hypothetical protein ACGFZA_42155 [Streptomyces sp. NPDC048211]|uniref:hypothetical protein n=1 Tax=Streptomyces sp. NPDC048211 TaxID=3365516 RepID=UPI00371914E4